MMGIGHIDMLPFLCGLVYFVGIWSIWAKFKRGMFGTALLELAVFVLLFKMHGGSVAGGTGATVASIMVGIFLSPSKAAAKNPRGAKYVRPR
jgi:hypothetical protein